MRKGWLILGEIGHRSEGTKEAYLAGTDVLRVEDIVVDDLEKAGCFSDDGVDN